MGIENSSIQNAESKQNQKSEQSINNRQSILSDEMANNYTKHKVNDIEVDNDFTSGEESNI